MGETRFTGLVVDWRGHMGWILPLTKVKHELASKHYGRVYLSIKDIVQYEDLNLRVKEGRLVDFYLYADKDGLGAEECRPRAVLRLTLTHSQVNTALKGYKAQWCDHLTSSKQYPAFEKETGALLRKYIWPMPFALVELWGHPDDLARAAVKLGTKGDSECHMRLLFAESESSKVETLAGTLPGGPKLSASDVLTIPVACKTLNWVSTPAECEEAAKGFIKAMGPKRAAAAA